MSVFPIGRPNCKGLHKPLQGQHKKSRIEGSCVSTEEAESGSHPLVQDSTVLMSKKSRLSQSFLLCNVQVCPSEMDVFQKKKSERERENIR